jgi:hypothetical protein
LAPIHWAATCGMCLPTAEAQDSSALFFQLQTVVIMFDRPTNRLRTIVELLRTLTVVSAARTTAAP